jgi:hypothetical protein
VRSPRRTHALGHLAALAHIEELAHVGAAQLGEEAIEIRPVDADRREPFQCWPRSRRAAGVVIRDIPSRQMRPAGREKLGR